MGEMIETVLATESKPVRFRAIKLEEESQYDSLLSPAFHVPNGGSFFDDFPVWRFGAGVPVLRVGAFSQGSSEGAGSLLSAASARTAYLQMGNDTLKIGIIGGVVTHPAAQGKGLASECVRLAEQWLANQGAPLAVLWSGEDQWYSRKGYFWAGHQYRIPLSSWPDAQALRSPLQLGEGWCTGIGRLLLSRKSGLRVQEWDLSWLKAHRNTNWYWLGSADSVSAYAAVGRGVDLQGTLHEWGGDPTALRRLFAELNRVNPGLQILGDETNLARAGILYDSEASEPLGLFKILDLKSLEMQLPTLRFKEMLKSESDWVQYFNSRKCVVWFWGLDAA